MKKGNSKDKIKDTINSQRSRSLWENKTADLFKFAPKLE